MLKGEYERRHNVDMSDYRRVLVLGKIKNRDHIPKQWEVFKVQDVDTFMNTADDFGQGPSKSP